MKFTVLALSALSLVSADNVRAANESRRLSFESIAGYAPGSQVTDHCAIDLDQKAMETELSKGTEDAYLLAQQIYSSGAHSKSYAQVTLTAGLTTALNKGKAATGKDSQGRDVAGKIYATYDAGEMSIRFQYSTTDIQSSYVNCQVGALEALGNVDGCLAASGSITVDEEQLEYTYDVNTDNNNGRSISGFSTAAEAKMADYTDFKYFKEYYGVGDYGDQWVNAAFAGTATSFTNGNADFSQYGFTGRTEAIKKGTVYFHVFMYVIREFEDALDDCKKGCNDCNDDPVHAWDEGVCFYTGSLEEQDGITSDGKLLHQLADKRCQNFKTCGPDGDAITGVAKMNIDLFNLLSEGKQQVANGQCDAARITTADVAKTMYIPLIQGSLRYAYKVGAQDKGEKDKAEGAVFSAAVLPRVHAADPAAAKVIYDNLRVGAPSTDFAAVKTAFESVYEAMGIECSDIGGLYNDATAAYYEGMEPCGLPADTSSAATSTLAVAAAVGAAALML